MKNQVHPQLDESLSEVSELPLVDYMHGKAQPALESADVGVRKRKDSNRISSPWIE